MDHTLSVGSAIIDRYFEYYEHNTLDDETELFPTLHIICTGAADACPDGERREQALDELIEHARKRYCDLWLCHAVEDEGPDNIDLDAERREAVATFDRMFPAR